MNCPGHVQIFKHGLKSYRDLPLRMAEFGAVSRYEPSGALHGLMRVRAFTQDDAHVFCTEDQLASECLKINDLILSTYADFGFDEIVVKLSTRPEKRVGSDALWDHAEEVMTRVLAQIEEQSGGRIKTAINPGGAPSTARKFESTSCATPSAATGNAARRRSTSTCRSGSARSSSMPTARRRPRYGPPGDLRLDGALHRHPDRAFRRPLPALAGAAPGGRRDDHRRREADRMPARC